MKKSLISVAILAALSSTQVSAGGPKFNTEGILSVPCVEAGGRYFKGVLEQRGRASTNFKLILVEEEKLGADACGAASELLTEGGVGIDEDSDDEDSGDNSDDEDSDDDPQETPKFSEVLKNNMGIS